MLKESRFHYGRVDKLGESQIEAKVAQRSCWCPSKRPLHDRVKAFCRTFDDPNLGSTAAEHTHTLAQDDALQCLSNKDFETGSQMKM